MSSKNALIINGKLNLVGAEHAEYNYDASSTISIRQVFQQWVVVDVIFDPIVLTEKKVQQLEEKYRLEYGKTFSNLERYVRNKVLPRNTIIAAKVIMLDQGVKYEVDKLMFLYPFFPPALSMPCKPGEHVWVMFENLTSIDPIGYWVCGVVGSGVVDDVNHSHYPRINQSSFVEGDASEKWEKTSQQGNNQVPSYNFDDGTLFLQDRKIYERILTTSEGSDASVYESVPRFKKRPGDIAFEGSNNTLIVLGRDRTGSAVEYTTVDTSNPNNPTNDGPKSVSKDKKAFFKKRNAGSIDIVAGRGQKESTAGKTVINTLLNPELDKSINSLMPNEGDPDFKNDRSRIYVSQNAEIDKSLELQRYNEKLGVKDTQTGDASIIVKTDKIRIFARSDVQILVTGFNSFEKLVDVTENASNRQDLKDEALSKTKDIIKDQKDDSKSWASITIKSNGDIIFKPSDSGYIKLGDETADKAILCTDVPVDSAAMQGDIKIHDPIRGKTNPGGAVPIFTTGNKQIGTGEAGQGTFSRKVLIK